MFPNLGIARGMKYRQDNDRVTSNEIKSASAAGRTMTREIIALA